MNLWWLLALCLIGRIEGRISFNLDNDESIQCTKIEQSSCKGFSGSINCYQKAWNAHAVVTYKGYGLLNINSHPSNTHNFFDIHYNELDNFESSATVRFAASCCDTEVDLVAVDSNGNVGICSYDAEETMSEQPQVLTFEVVAAGPTWLYLEWTLDYVDSSLIRFRLETDNESINDLTTSMVCNGLVCNHNSTFLAPCSLHQYTLTPYYEQEGSLVPGIVSFTDGETTDVVPNPPTNGRVELSGSVVTISWDVPANDQCIEAYEVCYSVDSIGSCILTNETSIIVDDFYYCTNYSIYIVSQTASGLMSSPYVMYTKAVDGTPGPPSNLHMVLITAYSANISWDKPLINPACANDYDVNWKPVQYSELLGLQALDNEVSYSGEYWAVVAPLIPCVRYSFSVSAYSQNNTEGPTSTIYDTAKEITPAAPAQISVTTSGAHSIHVSWTPGGTVCVDHYLLCYENSRNNEKVCIDEHTTDITIENLDSCTPYLVTVLVVSPEGLVSGSIYGFATTDDENPGPPTNLETIDTKAHSITIEFDPPTINPQCVAEYQITYTDIRDYFTGSPHNNVPDTPESNATFVSVINGLEACTFYNIKILTVSPQGLESSSVNTSSTTLEDLPSAPVNLVAITKSTTSIELHWNIPEANSRCVDYFSIMWVSDDNLDSKKERKDILPGQFSFKYLLENLEPCKGYDVAVIPTTASEESGAISSTYSNTLC